MIRVKLFSIALILSNVSGIILGFELTLLHTNDVHAHYEQMNKYGGRCPQSEADKGACTGGTARLATKVNAIRANESEKNVLFLNAGDYFQGTIYYNLFSSNITSVFVNYLGYEAMCLGNHEFDRGVEGLVPFLEEISLPILACNIDVTNEPRLRGKIGCTTTFNYTSNGKIEYIGIVGYLTPETSFLSSPGPTVKFTDEIEALTPVVQKLKDSGINKIIALGHSGVTRDQEIAEKIPGIDIVVGGHSHTFLYTGKPPSSEEPKGPYPIEIKRSDGSIALVLQAYWSGKYLGYIKVNFTDDGDVKSWAGEPILLDSKIPEDIRSLEILAPYKKLVDENAKQVIGRTGVLLRGDRSVCRMQECNMGNFITDAIVSHFRLKNFNDEKELSVSIWNSGGIRASIDEIINNSTITMEDVTTVAPFANTIDVVFLSGKGVRNIMEHSVEHYDPSGNDPPGAFLQVSGIHVVYDLTKPPNGRVVSLKLLCNECRVPKYFEVDDEKNYTVAIPTYMVQGGDGFTSIQRDASVTLLTGDIDTDIIVEYLQNYNPVFTAVEERIVFTNLSSCPSSGSRVTTVKIFYSALLIVFLLKSDISKLLY